MTIDIKKLKEFTRRWFLPLALTALVLMLMGYVAFPQVANCLQEWITWQQPAYSFLQPSSSCMTPNEIGDFLAGVFAPLAFVWLAFAVVLQSQELKEQREILDLTRKEYEETRKVAEKQHEALAQQANTMGLTARLTAEQQARKDLETLIEMIRPRVSKMAGDQNSHHKLSDADYMRDRGKDASRKLELYLQGKGIQPNNLEKAMEQARDLRKTVLVEITTLEDRLGKFDHALYEQYGLPELARALERVKPH